MLGRPFAEAFAWILFWSKRVDSDISNFYFPCTKSIMCNGGNAPTVWIPTQRANEQQQNGIFKTFNHSSNSITCMRRHANSLGTCAGKRANKNETCRFQPKSYVAYTQKFSLFVSTGSTMGHSTHQPSNSKAREHHI